MRKTIDQPTTTLTERLPDGSLDILELDLQQTVELGLGKVASRAGYLYMVFDNETRGAHLGDSVEQIRQALGPKPDEVDV